jgi:tetratricopeptide (TPR) repeat protein
MILFRFPPKKDLQMAENGNGNGNGIVDLDKLIVSNGFGQSALLASTKEGPTADAAAIALAGARPDPESEFGRKAAAYLDLQGELTALTIDRFDRHDALTSQQMQLSIRAAKRKAVSDHLRLAVQILFAIIPLFLVAGIGVMVYGAVTSHSVVVDTFQAPPALASTGVTGQVVATGLLDDLQKLQDTGRWLTGNPSDRKSAWSSEVKIGAPESGILVGELDRVLRARLGRDVHIDGNLVQTSTGGLALTVRGDEVGPKTFEGAATDLDKLTTQAAEYVYGRSQPYQYFAYLQANHRDTEALDFVAGAVQRANDDALRARLANGWGTSLQALNRPADALQKYHLAMSLQPFYWTPRGNAIVALAGSEGEEAAWRESRAMLTAVEAAPKQDRPRPFALSNPTQLTWDMPWHLAALLDGAAGNNGGGVDLATQPQIATAYASMHNASLAARYLATSDATAPATQEAMHQIALLQAVDRNDLGSAVVDADALWKVWQANPQLQAGDDSPCMAALVLGMAGRTADSDAIFAKIGPWSRCTAAHGQILEHQGNLAAAQAMWADGINRSPDLPFDYMARGLSEENRGDMTSAEADLKKASANAPHFADPIKLYGDLLAREGRWKEAFSKYEEALKYAPNWAAIH